MYIISYIWKQIKIHIQVCTQQVILVHEFRSQRTYVQAFVKFLLNFYLTCYQQNYANSNRNILLTQQIQHWPPWIKWFQSCCYAKYFSCVSLLIPWCWWKSVSHFRVIIWISWKWCKKKKNHTQHTNQTSLFRSGLVNMH